MKKVLRLMVWAMVCLPLALTACTSEKNTFVPSPTSGSRYAIDPVFRELYQTLGGEKLLGPVISPTIQKENMRCQYLETALMCFNPNATDANRIGFYPLGKELGLKETHLPESIPSSGARQVDGFIIYDEFTRLYDQLYGAHYTGRPLSNVRINYDLNRIEQFFENLGFYRNLGDPPGKVQLIPYGAYLYTETVSTRHAEVWNIIGSAQVEQPFATSIARMGGPSRFGRPLTLPYPSRDGSLEQVYESAVFFASPSNPSMVRLRPLAATLGIPIDPLETKNPHPQLVFYEIEGGLGFNVPVPFDEFIAMHGGRDLSGNPIMPVYQMEGQQVYRQCFENYCLDYDLKAGESLRVRLVPLGKLYMKRAFQSPSVLVRNPFSESTILLQVSETRPQVTNQEEQHIMVLVVQKDNQQPVENVEATLMVTLPDGSRLTYPVPPTRANGMSTVTVPAIKTFKNGSMVGYQVCLKLPSEKPICASEAYLIWGSQ
jgi:hypothetical protein